jgi:uncharacterized integral membrane protein
MHLLGNVAMEIGKLFKVVYLYDFRKMKKVLVVVIAAALICVLNATFISADLYREGADVAYNFVTAHPSETELGGKGGLIIGNENQQMGIGINVADDNITFSVSPEISSCPHTSCTSRVTIYNLGMNNITFGSDQLIINTPDALYSRASHGKIRDLHNITIEPNSSETFTVQTVYAAEGDYKYDVTFSYGGNDYTIDPYFDTTPDILSYGRFMTPIADSMIYEQSPDENYGGDGEMCVHHGVVVNSTVFHSYDFSAEPLATANNLTLRLNFIELSGAMNNGSNFSIYFCNGTIDEYGITWNNNTMTDCDALPSYILPTGELPLNDMEINVTSLISRILSNPLFTLKFNIDRPDTVLNQYYWCYSSRDYNPPRIAISYPNYQYVVSEQDSYISEYSPNDNYGGELSNIAQSGFVLPKWDYDAIMFVQYNFTDVAAYTNLTLALTLIQADMAESPYTMHIYYCDDTFDEYSITWNTATVVCENTAILNLVGESFVWDIQNLYAIETLKAKIAADTDKIFTLEFNITPSDQVGGMAIGTLSKESINPPELFAWTFYPSNCTPNWTAQYGICQTNDTMLKTYTDSNLCGVTTGLPFDNNTEVYCNYCSQDLNKTNYGLCQNNGTVNFDWTDNNYYGCCAITGILADCGILYSPYNETGTEPCLFAFANFQLDMDSEVYFGFGNDKVYGKIWLNDTVNNYSCISYVKTATNQTIQTNPAYATYTDSAIWQHYTEERQFFFPSNGITSVYWTKENLVIDGRQYLFGVECAGNGQDLKSETIVTVLYENVNAPTTRFFWLQSQWSALIIGFIMVLVLAVIIFFVWRLAKDG